MLKASVQGWNGLRKSDPAYVPDLSAADLEGRDLSGAYLKLADLRGAYLNGAKMAGADLRSADLRRAHLSVDQTSGVHEIKNLQQQRLSQWGPTLRHVTTVSS